jgi:hypothetical protein
LHLCIGIGATFAATCRRNGPWPNPNCKTLKRSRKRWLGCNPRNGWRSSMTGSCCGPCSRCLARKPRRNRSALPAERRHACWKHPAAYVRRYATGVWLAKSGRFYQAACFSQDSARHAVRRSAALEPGFDHRAGFAPSLPFRRYVRGRYRMSRFYGEAYDGWSERPHLGYP